MQTLVEKYQTPEDWNSGANHEEAKRLAEEERQKELAEEVEEPKERNEHLDFANKLLSDFCAINLIGRVK